MKISPKVLCNFNDIDGKIKAGFGLFFGIESWGSKYVLGCSSQNNQGFQILVLVPA